MYKNESIPYIIISIMIVVLGVTTTSMLYFKYKVEDANFKISNLENHIEDLNLRIDEQNKMLDEVYEFASSTSRELDKIK